MVAKHLLDQGRPSLGTPRLDGVTNCAYRGRDGTKCAVGVLIPDEVYVPTMESLRAHAVVAGFCELEHLGPHWELLNELQGVHDSEASWGWDPARVRAGLRRVAEAHELDASVLASS